MLLCVFQNRPSQPRVLSRVLNLSSFQLRHLLPMGEPTFDQRPRLFLGMLVHPPNVLRFRPSVKTVWQGDRRSDENMMKYDQRLQPRSVLWGSQHAVFQEQKRSTTRLHVTSIDHRWDVAGLPHCSQCTIVIRHRSPISTTPPPWLALIRHESAQGKLQLCHVARQLKLPRFAKWFCNRYV